MNSDDVVTHEVDHAVALLRNGGLVAFATETVYGLGADAENDDAVARVFAVKARPTNHPLIVHVKSVELVDRYAIDVSPYATQLMTTLWPGPLTVIVARRPETAAAAAGGLPTLGLRVPAHPTAHALLDRFGRGVAAPSANRFGRVSSTTASHVLSELGEQLDPARDCILDGGATTVGVESTIVDCTGNAPAIRRSGFYSVEDIETACDMLVVSHSTVAAPGTLAAHYAPNARVVVVADEAELELVASANYGAGVLALAAVETPPDCHRLASPTTAADFARVLYAALRDADDRHLATVIAVPPDDVGIGRAVRDRLRRAAFTSST